MQAEGSSQESPRSGRRVAVSSRRGRTPGQGSRGPKVAACERCRRRKQRCGYERPSCTACEKASETCEYPDNSPAHDDQYIQWLESRVRELSRPIQDIPPIDQSLDQSLDPDSPFLQPDANEGFSVPGPTHRDQALDPSSRRQRSFQTSSRPQPLARNDSGLMPRPTLQSTQRPTLHRDRRDRLHVSFTRERPDVSDPTFVPPRFISLSPAETSRHHPWMPLDVDVDDMQQSPPSANQLIDRLPLSISQYVTSQHESAGAGPSLEPVSAPMSRTSSVQNSLTELSTEEVMSARATLPEGGEIDKLVKRFLLYYNSAFGIFHEPSLTETVDKVQKAPTVSHHDIFIVFMILAIASASKIRGRPARSKLYLAELSYWERARIHCRHATAVPGLKRLQALHLLLHYLMIHPEAGNVWLIAGITIRVAIELGLHYEKKPAGSGRVDLLHADLRRRLFWTTFCMDVNLSLPLGRPLGLSWDWVDTKMPSLLADSDLQKGISESAPGGLPCPAKKLLHHVIRLRQLQAEIYRTQYPVAASRREPDYRWMEDVQSRLEQWRAESPPVLDNAAIVHDTWSLISYHISISLLNRPCPGNPKPTERQLERALDSSSATMQTFKNMYRRGSISMVWLAINHLFMAGVTYLSCLLLAPATMRVPTIVEAMLDVQACSSVLESLASIQPGAAGVRDAFERVSAAVIRALSDRTSQAYPQPAPPLTPDTDRSSGARGMYSSIRNPSLSLVLDTEVQGQPVPTWTGEIPNMDQTAWESLQAMLFDSSFTLDSLNPGQPELLSFGDLETAADLLNPQWPY